MLRWRRKSELKRHKLWAKLVACSLGMHLIFLTLLFVGYRDNIKLIFSMSGQPLSQKSASVTLFTIPEPKKIVRPTRVASRRSVAQKVLKKPITKVAAKKPAPKKISQAKPVPKPEPKPVQAKQVASAAVNKQANKKEPLPVALPVPDKPIQFDMAQNIDPSIMEDFVLLQQELTKHWQPPVGIAHECACEITAQIDRQGKIEDIKIDTPSGVLMFDVAARTAMLAMELPKWTWGKSLTITFKP